MNRRSFLKSIAVGASALDLLFLERAWGAPNSQSRFFVMLRVSGGMDSTLGLEPWLENPASENEFFLGYGKDAVIRSGAISLGPAAHPLVPYVKDIAIINGMVMHDSNVDHGANTQYIRTGRGTGAPDVALRLSLANGGPRGIIANAAINSTSLSTFTMSVASDLVELAGVGSDLSAICPFVNTMRPTSYSESLKRSCSSRQITTDLFSNFSRLKKDPFYEDLIGDDMKMLIASFLSGSCFQAQWLLTPKTGVIDSHASHLALQLPAQLNIWEQVASIFKAFKATSFEQKSLFDFTTFFAVSEFSRTPALNSSNGKDHNPQTNSVLLAGGGIKGGTSLGQSLFVDKNHSKIGIPVLWGLPIDFKTGQLAKTIDVGQRSNFNFIVPENLVGTLLSRTFNRDQRSQLGFDEASYPLIEGLFITGT